MEPAEQPNPVPTVGRIVHFAYGEKTCAAIITDVTDADVGLTVWPPPSERESAGAQFTTRATYSSDGLPATWRYPPRV